MERRLFGDLVLSRSGGGHTRAGAMPFSVVIHGAALAGLLAASLATPRELPPITSHGPIVDSLLRPGSSAAVPSPPRRTVVRRATAAPTFDTVPAVVPQPEALSFDQEPTGDPGPEGDGDCIGCAPAIGGPDGATTVGDPAATASDAAPPAPHRISSRLEAPRKTHHVDPVYPELARAAHVSGTVILECVIGRDGRVRSVTVLRGHPLLEAAAAGAVRQWTYRPTLLNGVPVDVVMTVTVRFSF